VHPAWDLYSDLLVFYSRHPVFWTILIFLLGCLVRPLKLLKKGTLLCLDNYYGFLAYCRESKARHEHDTRIIVQKFQ
jgi:hypothetical protein